LRVRRSAPLTEAEWAALGEAARAAGFADLREVGEGPADLEIAPVGEGGLLLDAWALVTEPFSSLRAVSSEQLRRLMAPDARWSAAGGPDVPVRRLGDWPPAPAGRAADRSAYAAIRRAVSETPGALALLPAGAVDPSVRVLAVDGVSPIEQPE